MHSWCCRLWGKIVSREKHALFFAHHCLSAHALRARFALPASGGLLGTGGTFAAAGWAGRGPWPRIPRWWIIFELVWLGLPWFACASGERVCCGLTRGFFFFSSLGRGRNLAGMTSWVSPKRTVRWRRLKFDPGLNNLKSDCDVDRSDAHVGFQNDVNVGGRPGVS